MLDSLSKFRAVCKLYAGLKISAGFRNCCATSSEREGWKKFILLNSYVEAWIDVLAISLFKFYTEFF
jgi:hypothetical protein